MNTEELHVNRNGRALRLTLLVAGPFLTLALANSIVGQHVQPTEMVFLHAVVFLAWSPLFFSIPAILCQKERDNALSGYTGVFGSLYRGLILLPYLMGSKSQVRVETAASLLAWVLLGVVVHPSLNAVFYMFTS